MRDLTKKQKTFLLKWANDNPDKMNSYIPVDNMETEDWEKLTEMNDTEVLYQNCNGFLNDLERKNYYAPIEKIVYSLPT